MVSFITELWQLYLAWGVVAAMGSAALYVVPTMALSKFFNRKRGLTVGWSSVGVSAGQAGLGELREFEERIQAVTPVMVREAMRKYYDPNRLVEGIVRGKRGDGA